MAIRALEFYSGIGGLHIALQTSSVNATVVGAFDWDQTACNVYAANFGSSIVQRVDISNLTASAIATFDASLWLLSPSCQPYTVLNPVAKGAADPRAQSFLHLVRKVIPDLVQVRKAPRWLLVENVAGFETSTTRDTLVTVLERNGYNSIEMLLTPQQFGIPNSRLRYYLLAKARPLFFVQAPSADGGRFTWPYIPTDKTHAGMAATNIQNYLDPDELLWEEHPCRVPDRTLIKWGKLFDIVRPDSCRSCCFTRGYTHMVERTGSILQMNDKLDTTTIFDEFLAAPSHSAASAVTILHPLKLRYFSTSELLRIFHLSTSSKQPDSSESLSTSFTWPESVSEKTKYRLIGNSVNVEVVRRLINYLFAGDNTCSEDMNKSSFRA